MLRKSWNALLPEGTDRRSVDQLAFSIGFVVTRSRALLRRILTEHAPDDARQMLAQRVVQHMELSGFEIDESEQVLRKRPPARTMARALRPLRRLHLEPPQRGLWHAEAAEQPS
jgi:hypothetical protein